MRQARAEPETLAREASERYGYPAGFLARYFEKLRYRFGPRERAGLFTFFELAHGADELADVPELRFVREEIFQKAGASAGTEQKIEELARFIRDAGRVPVQRDTLYNELERID